MKIEAAFEQSRGVPRQEVLDVGPVRDLVSGNHLLHNRTGFSGGQYDFNLHAPLPRYRAIEAQVFHASVDVLFQVYVDCVAQSLLWSKQILARGQLASVWRRPLMIASALFFASSSAYCDR
jgi:hypothetical protein